MHLHKHTPQPRPLPAFQKSTTQQQATAASLHGDNHASSAAVAPVAGRDVMQGEQAGGLRYDGSSCDVDQVAAGMSRLSTSHAADIPSQIGFGRTGRGGMIRARSRGRGRGRGRNQGATAQRSTGD